MELPSKTMYPDYYPMSPFRDPDSTSPKSINEIVSTMDEGMRGILMMNAKEVLLKYLLNKKERISLNTSSSTMSGSALGITSDALLTENQAIDTVLGRLYSKDHPDKLISLLSSSPSRNFLRNS